MVNRLIIAAAGSGKTTYLVRQAMQQADNVLITTYTIANELEIRKKFIEHNGCVPHNVTLNISSVVAMCFTLLDIILTIRLQTWL